MAVVQTGVREPLRSMNVFYRQCSLYENATLHKYIFSAHVIVQPCRHTTSKAFQELFGVLQVRRNEISLHNWSGGTAHLRT